MTSTSSSLSSTTAAQWLLWDQRQGQAQGKAGTEARVGGTATFRELQLWDGLYFSRQRIKRDSCLIKATIGVMIMTLFPPHLVQCTPTYLSDLSSVITLSQQSSQAQILLKYGLTCLSPSAASAPVRGTHYLYDCCFIVVLSSQLQSPCEQTVHLLITVTSIASRGSINVCLKEEEESKDGERDTFCTSYRVAPIVLMYYIFLMTTLQGQSYYFHFTESQRMNSMVFSSATKMGEAQILTLIPSTPNPCICHHPLLYHYVTEIICLFM